MEQKSLAKLMGLEPVPAVIACYGHLLQVTQPCVGFTSGGGEFRCDTWDYIPGERGNDERMSRLLEMVNVLECLDQTAAAAKFGPNPILRGRQLGDIAKAYKMIDMMLDSVEPLLRRTFEDL